jgi:DNA-binding transcriptional LysR family regulator
LGSARRARQAAACGTGTRRNRGQRLHPRRTARGSQLTPNGLVVTEWAARLLDVAHHVDTGLGSLRTERRRQTKVVASQTIAEQLMPRWLVSLQAAATQRGGTAPNVILTATNSDHAIAAVREGTADLGFIESPGTPRGLRSRVVAHDELVVIVPPDHKWARRSRVVSAAELAQTPLVTREVGSGTCDSLTAALHHALGEEMQQSPPCSNCHPLRRCAPQCSPARGQR